MQLSQHNRLTDATLPLFNSEIKNSVFWVIIGSFLIAISSKISIPFIPVPFTMQTYVILVLAMAMGFKLATSTLVTYLAQGAIGLPVFAKGGGIAYFAGPTGGYLFGFLFAAMAVGFLADRGFDKSIPKAVVAMVIGNILIYVPGVAWLGTVMQSMEKGLMFGLYPYIYGDLLKIAMGAATLPLAWKVFNRK